ncbi:uncharacterized protein LOC105380091 [Plutella xylostella]|uniref:uncharacterized protein LOC105380091 n=1 Tax=Plutella xylostella TaxID=51655 RepID=UPI002032817C|nr:uncharacterized protein LOC105380091 [Plutella xylostella]
MIRKKPKKRPVKLRSDINQLGFTTDCSAKSSTSIEHVQFMETPTTSSDWCRGGSDEDRYLFKSRLTPNRKFDSYVSFKLHDEKRARKRTSVRRHSSVKVKPPPSPPPQQLPNFPLLNIYGRWEPVKDPNATMNWKTFHRLDVINKFLNTLEYEYPSTCSVYNIATTAEGRQVKLIKISNGIVGNYGVWLDAGIHAREWIGPAVCTYVIDQIVRNYQTLPSYFKNKDWYIVPVLNPDGYEYSHTTDRMWRKNRSTHFGVPGCGVDLNRNFSLGWAPDKNQPTHANYRGPHPFSEAESIAVRDMLSSGIPFSVYISMHSFGQLIMFPYSHTRQICKNYVYLLEGSTYMSKAIYEATGMQYKVGISKDVLYGAAGTSADWAHGRGRVPYCYTIELRSYEHKFDLPEDQIEECAHEVFMCLHAFMSYFDAIGWQTKLIPLKLTSKCLIENKKVAPRRRKTQVWEAKLTKLGQRRFLRVLDTEGAINIWKEESSSVDIMVDGKRAASVAGLLHEREIAYSVAITDVGNRLDREKNKELATQTENNSTASMVQQVPTQKMDWTNYHRLDVIYDFMHGLAQEYPDLCSVCDIGMTSEGRPIKLLKISNGEPTNTGVWLDGCIHAREWISPAVVTYIANEIARGFDEHPCHLATKDWYFLPVVNPDGYEYSHTTDRMWRKNRARFGECVGVDLNRNFSKGWGEKDEEGSSTDPGNIFFRGPAPFSESESAAIRDTILSAEKPFCIYLSFHSYGEVIIFPWGYTAEPCPDYVELLQGGSIMAKAILGAHGNTYKVGSTKDLMYFASGTSVDWSYAVAGIPYSYMIELRDKHNRFLLPKNEILLTCSEIWHGIDKLLEYVDNRIENGELHICSCKAPPDPNKPKEPVTPSNGRITLGELHCSKCRKR